MDIEKLENLLNNIENESKKIDDDIDYKNKNNQYKEFLSLIIQRHI